MRSRWVPLILALIAASTFALAVQSAWWSAGEVTIGPFGSRHCFAGECRESGMSWLGGTDLWMRSGVATRAGGYIAMFVLVILAGGLAAKRVPKLMAKCAIVSILTAGVSGGYFAFGFPGLGGSSGGYGLLMFVAAVLFGFAAAVFTLRMPDPPRT